MIRFAAVFIVVLFVAISCQSPSSPTALTIGSCRVIVTKDSMNTKYDFFDITCTQCDSIAIHKSKSTYSDGTHPTVKAYFTPYGVEYNH